MMKKLIPIYIILLFSVSCDDLVDVTPKGFVIPETAADLRMLLNNVYTGFFEKRPITIGYDLVNFAADHTNFMDSQDIDNSNGRDAYSYFMRDQRVIEKNNYGDISKLYQMISLANLVLDIHPTTTDLTLIERNQIKGEALVHRAYCYLIMVNTYSRHYDAATASTDPGVPMPLTHDINVESLPRVSVQKVYDQILADLNEAVTLLGKANSNKATPSIGSAYALLSRTHLYMGNFDLALSNAKLALEDIDYLFDYQSYIRYNEDSTETTLKVPIRTWNCKEVVLFKWCHVDTKSSAPRMISVDFYKLFDKKDLRLKQYDKYLGGMKYGYDTRAFTGILTSELYLTQAECYARDNKLDSALTTLNHLRKHRFESVDYTPINVSTQDSVMTEILNERRRELAWTGLRWFDIKRLNLEPKYQTTITRTYKGNTITFSPTNRDIWVFPFPAEILIDGVIDQNP